MADILMFLWIQGIDGLSQDPRHLREINVETFSYGNKNPRAFGHGSQVESISDFEFVKRFDGISPILHQAVASGKHFAKAILTVERNFGGRSAGELLRVVMSDILLTRADSDSKNSGLKDQKFETVGLSYASLSWKQ